MVLCSGGIVCDGMDKGVGGGGEGSGGGFCDGMDEGLGGSSGSGKVE